MISSSGKKQSSSSSASSSSAGITVSATTISSGLGLTVAQEALLKQLKQKALTTITDESQGKKWLNECGDETYVRFLKGLNWKVDKAYKRIVATAEWRYRHSVNTLVEVWNTDTSKAVLLTHGHWPVTLCGPDHLGRPVQLTHLTGVDFPGLTREVGLDVMTRYMIYLLEKTIDSNPAGEGVVIVDLGLDSLWAGTMSEIRTWVNAVMKFFRKVASILEKHYPETLCKIFFTRVPKTFLTTFKLTKPFISSNTLAKIEILLEQSPVESLLKYMPIETVPELFGGKSNNITGLGGKIPKGALLDEAYMIQIASHVRILKGEMPASRESVRFSLSRTPEQEKEIQEQIALEMVRHHVQDLKHQSVGAHLRGSWNFVPGLDWLQNADDATILAQLQQDNLNPTQAFENLKLIAAQREEEEEKETSVKAASSSTPPKHKVSTATSEKSDDSDEIENTSEGAPSSTEADGNCCLM